MSLRFFHILFIGLSSLMSLFVGIWAIEAYRADGYLPWLLLAGLAIAGSGGLVVYGARFLQKTRKLGVVALLAAGTLTMPSDAAACAVCLGNTESALRSGMDMGILALLGITGFILACFASFFVYLAVKAKAAGKSENREPVHA